MKANKKIFFALAMMCGIQATNSVIGQSYKLLTDDPYTYNRLIVNLNLIELELASPATFRVGIGSEYNVARNLLVHADFNVTPLSTFNDEAIKKNQTSIEAGGIFAFSSNVKEGSKMKFQFNQHDQRYEAKIAASVLKQYCVRGGLSSFSGPKKHDDFISFTNSESLYAGFCVMRTKSVLVDVEDYGTFNRESRGKFYIDALFAPVLNVTDNTNYAAYYGSAAENLGPADFPELATSRIGARMGYMKRINKPVPLYQGFETGIRPGAGDIGQRFYVTFKIAISLGFMEGKSSKNP